jgi:hypothetical protein
MLQNHKIYRHLFCSPRGAHLAEIGAALGIRIYKTLDLSNSHIDDIDSAVILRNIIHVNKNSETTFHTIPLDTRGCGRGRGF